MTNTPQITPVEQIVARPAVAKQIREMIEQIPSSDLVGGFSISDKKSKKYGLVYWGAFPVDAEQPFRDLLEKYNQYEVSTVRNPSRFA